MAQTPNIKSQEQYLGEMLADWISRTEINDTNVGSIVTQLFDVVALVAARTSGDALQILRDLSVDRSTGDALQKIRIDENLPELPARVATGLVNITDTSFEKISTKIYAGSNPPNIGATYVDVSDASEFAASGNVYIGRGTPNVEGPIPYSAKTQIGSFWRLTLSTPTAKFHNTNESVILAQGGARSIIAGTIVKIPATGANSDINYTTTQTAVILDGETTVENVKISAQETGKIGNAPIGAIRQFSFPPFAGATVTNPLPIKNGRDIESEEELKIRIKRARLARGLGTSLAIENSVLGATPSDEEATIVSSKIITDANETTLYVDDGDGYEQKTLGVGIETLVESALGGETDFQLETGGRQTSVAKAFMVSTLSSPFPIAGGDRLAITVGGVTTEHTFQASDFLSPGAATAYEIVASINANSDLFFEASTAENGAKVSIQARANSNEDIQVADVTAGNDASVALGLPANRIDTLRLFKNKLPLSKDGSFATVRSTRQASWSSLIASGDTLIIKVDGTSFVTYTFTDADFIEEGSHVSVSPANSLESWVNVFNKKIVGVTASVVGEQIDLSSNLGASGRASIEIDLASTLVTKNLFSAEQGLSSVGKTSDYKFSRNTAQIKLTQPLDTGDELTLGSRDTEARVEADRILGGVVTLSTDAAFWALFDDSSAEIVNTAVTASSVLGVSKPSANIVRYTSSSPSAFSNVQVGDYVIIWSEELSSGNRLEGRVNAVTATTLDLKVTPAEYAAAVIESGIVFLEGFIVIRTDKVPQKFIVQSGVKTVSEIADELSQQTLSAEFSVIDDEILVVSTKTKTSNGYVLIVTVDESAKSLNLNPKDSDFSKDSLVSVIDSGYREGSFPLFINGKITSNGAAVPPSTYLTSLTTALNLLSLGIDPSLILGYLNPFGTILDGLSVSENTELSNYSGLNLTIKQDPLVKRLRSDDRVYLAAPMDFGHQDSMVAILDNDEVGKTFNIPLYRRAQTNTSLAVNPNNFNAYDTDGGPTEQFSTFFPSFDFSNFKVLMQAKRVVDQSAAEDAILFRSVRWGRSGEKINVAYTYPTAPNLGIQHTAQIGEDVKVRISLKSGAAVPTTIDGTTEWNVTVTPNNPVAGVDQVTYSWNTVGTAPGLGGLSGGEYVTIAQGSELDVANTGTFRVSTEVGFAPTANSFTVVRKNGEAVAESAKATLVGTVFSFYNASPTTALEISTYVNSSSLADIVSAALVDDSGTSGSGVISLSTSEFSNFAVDYLWLYDGVNWVLSSNVGGSPQFSFKRALSYVTDTGYSFNAGENLRLVPTSIEQLSRFFNVLSVTGYTTLGSVKLSDREGKLSLTTSTVGGEGAVQVVGGTANSAVAPVLNSATLIGNTKALTSISRPNLAGFHSDQWVKLVAGFKQLKSTLFKATASVAIDGDFETVGKSKISVLGRTLTDRHFSKPRNHTRLRGRTFKVERHGDFTCLSWDEVGTEPFFSKQLGLNLTAGGTLNIEKVSSSEADIFVLTGPLNFIEVSIGDMLSVSGMDNSENNGTFIVTGVDEDGKRVRVLNPNAVSEFSTATATILNNATITGDEFIVSGNSLIAGVDFTVGATASDTAANLASAIGALPGVSATSNSNVVTIEATTPEASISLVYNDLGGGGGGSVSGPFLVGRGYTTSDFSCTTSVAEGDTVVIGSPFAILNRGKFRIVRRFLNSVYFENANSVEETVSVPANLISLGHDGTTEFDIEDTNNRLTIRWNGSGTEPSLGVARPGDEITLGTDFDPDNQGTFMVVKSGEALAEKTRVSCIAASLITTGDYWEINAADDSTEYYVWYDVDGGGGDPAIVGKTGIQVSISSSDTAIQVANATSAAIDALADFEADSDGNLVTVTTSGEAETTDATTGNMDATFDVDVIQQGQRTFIECLNPSPVAESGILITDVLELHRPQVLFYEYEATVPGDTLILSGDLFGQNNQGNWIVDRVIDQDTVLVTGSMEDLEPVSIASSVESISVEEGEAYTGYKKISFVVSDPASTARGLILFDTKEQYEKINEIGSVQISALNKLQFSTGLQKGLDSYRYHIGLIGEANRIVYGDPRDRVTYKGFAAAGAEINIREPLFRRIRLGIDVRINTGIPFAQIIEQVRTNISALIGSNPIGESIAISDIVETVNEIPGVVAVAINSPLYDSSNDVIRISPSEKARIIDPISDILVRQIGT